MLEDALTCSLAIIVKLARLLDRPDNKEGVDYSFLS
jgi:hypothetical protein